VHVGRTVWVAVQVVVGLCVGRAVRVLDAVEVGVEVGMTVVDGLLVRVEVSVVHCPIRHC